MGGCVAMTRDSVARRRRQSIHEVEPVRWSPDANSIAAQCLPPTPRRSAWGRPGKIQPTTLRSPGPATLPGCCVKRMHRPWHRFRTVCPLDWPKRYVMRSAPLRSSLGIAAHHDATPAQVTLAWLLAIADNVPLIPGTSSRSHLAENLAAVSVSLQDDEVASLRAAFAEPRSVDQRDAHRFRRPAAALHLPDQAVVFAGSGRQLRRGWA
jgi:hypothetical protein